MSVPKKHHYVPQFLLRIFADTPDQLMVHRADRNQEYQANVGDLGHRNLGHSLYWPDREPDHVSLETRMTEIEGARHSDQPASGGAGRAHPPQTSAKF